MALNRCNECRHLPSCRFDAAGAQCFCECHDAADKVPEMVELMQLLMKRMREIRQSEQDKTLVERAETVADEVKGLLP